MTLESASVVPNLATGINNLLVRLFSYSKFLCITPI